MLTMKDAIAILIKYRDELKDAPCSTGHHLNVVGGLMIHLNNVETVAMELDIDNEQLVALATIHDIGKARTYELVHKDDKVIIQKRKPAIDHLINTIAMIYEAGFILEPEELHALQFHHGGWSPFKGDMNELAVKLHYCDMLALAQELAQ